MDKMEEFEQFLVVEKSQNLIWEINKMLFEMKFDVPQKVLNLMDRSIKKGKYDQELVQSLEVVKDQVTRYHKEFIKLNESNNV